MGLGICKNSKIEVFPMSQPGSTVDTADDAKADVSEMPACTEQIYCLPPFDPPAASGISADFKSDRQLSGTYWLATYMRHLVLG